MTLELKILGKPGRDNALLVTISTGQAQHQLLFDCGEGVLGELPVSWVQAIEAVFFSHFHIDHIAGFDSFFRLNWWRAEPPVRLFGPPGAIELLHHRLQGVTWNLVAGVPGEVHVCEVDGSQIRKTRYLTREGFSIAHPQDPVQFDGVVYRGEAFDVSAVPLHHGTVSLGYVVREHDRKNVDPGAMAEAGLKPGPWVRVVKDVAVQDIQEIEIQGQRFRVGELRQRLMSVSPGDSVAYLTDFLLPDEASIERVVDALRGCRTVVCENNYRDADAELARKNFHMTSSDVGKLAVRVQPEKLILFHLSDRYTPAEWQEQLMEVQRIFPATTFPLEWNISD